MIEVQLIGDAASFQRSMGAAGSATERFGVKTKASIGGAVKSFAKFAAGAVGIVGVGRALTTVARNTIEFDREMRSVNSLAGLSEDSFKALQKEVLSLAGDVGQAPKTLAMGLNDLVGSGFNAKDSMVILASSAKAATAGLTTTDVSTKAIAATLNAYRLPATRAAHVTDALFKTVDLGVVSFEELAGSIGDVLPYASSLGIDITQVGAAIATMTKQGLSGAESTTRLKAVMSAFIKPSTDMSEAIRATGFESGEALIKSRGLQGAMEAVAGTSDGTKEALATLFPNVRALGGVLSLTGNNTKAAAADLKAFGDVSGATNTVFLEQSKSVALQWEKLKQKVNAFAIGVGVDLIPVLLTAVRILDENKTAIMVVVGALLTAKATAITYGATVATVTFVTGGWTAAFWGLNAAMRANPIGIVVTALALLAGAIVVAYKNSETFRSAVDGLFNLLKGAGLAALNLVIGAFDKLAGGVSTLFGGLGKVPGFGWASDASERIDRAREATRGWKDQINGIPAHKSVTIDVHEITRKTIIGGAVGAIDRKARGGLSRGGLTLVGEEGPELVELQAGSFVHTASKTRGLLSSGQRSHDVPVGGDTVVNFNAPVGSQRAARIAASELAYSLRFG
ncbi:MAG: phage tail tape measure protein [Solirubrobacteraceae bacterium]|nr:phage tail tape measure protein [Solirubrobacteraceae bacterium]